MKKLKIAMLMDSWTPIEGGGQTHVKNLAEILCKEKDCNIDLFTRSLKDESGNIFNKNEAFYEGRFRVFRTGFSTKFANAPARIFWLLAVIYKVLRLNREKKYDLIHAHSLLPAIPAKILAFIIKKPLIYTVHGTALDLKKKNLNEKIERFLLCKIKYDCLVSVAENFLQEENINKEIFIIANGVNVKDFDLDGLTKFKKFNFLFVGRFDKIKAVDNLIKAFSNLNNENVCLDLVGYGYEEEHLKKLVKKLNPKGEIKFHGKKTGRELAEIYLKSHVFVLPSLSEGQPISILEAWAAKLPVIATRVGDNEKFIQDKKDGFLVKNNDITDLEIVMRETLNCKNLKEIGENGFKKVKNEYSSEICAEKTFQKYLKII